VNWFLPHRPVPSPPVLFDCGLPNVFYPPPCPPSFHFNLFSSMLGCVNRDTPARLSCLLQSDSQSLIFFFFPSPPSPLLLTFFSVIRLASAPDCVWFFNLICSTNAKGPPRILAPFLSSWHRLFPRLFNYCPRNPPSSSYETLTSFFSQPCSNLFFLSFRTFSDTPK